MFLKALNIDQMLQSFPRARGDVPSLQRLLFGGVTVFPAHAGMFRLVRSLMRRGISFPRARGDVPSSNSSSPNPAMFSPRTRGCSLLVMQDMNGLRVFPAHAGMFRA